MARKICTICESEFEAKGNWRTCSAKCSVQGNRKTRIRYCAENAVIVNNSSLLWSRKNAEKRRAKASSVKKEQYAALRAINAKIKMQHDLDPKIIANREYARRYYTVNKDKIKKRNAGHRAKANPETEKKYVAKRIAAWRLLKRIEVEGIGALL